MGWKMLRAGSVVAAGLAFAMAACSSLAAADRMPIFDTHVHYSRSAWDAVPPHAVIAKLEAAGVVRSLVSSSPDDGTLKLQMIDAARFQPVLRPYRAGVNASNWPYDEGTVGYLSARMKRNHYAGIGEFHLQSEAAARTPVLREVARLALQYSIPLHVHSDAGLVEILLEQTPKLKILWAHAGLVTPVEQVRRTMEKYPQVSAELAFRADDILAGERLNPVWRELILRYSKRFMIGSDTYVDGRWAHYGEIIADHRRWLRLLPEDIAREIAYGNAVRLFGHGGLAALRR